MLGRSLFCLPLSAQVHVVPHLMHLDIVALVPTVLDIVEGDFIVGEGKGQPLLDTIHPNGTRGGHKTQSGPAS